MYSFISAIPFSTDRVVFYVYGISFAWTCFLKKTETIDGKEYAHQYGYDQYGNITKETYPDGYYVTKEYDQYGYLQTVKDPNGTVIWEFKACDGYGNITAEKLGGQTKYTDRTPGGMVTREWAGNAIYNVYDYYTNTIKNTI